MTTKSEQKSVEYWCAREPFLSSHRAIGHIEAVSILPSASEVTLLIRGWLFDKHQKLSNLKMFLSGNPSVTSVCGMERLDVVKNFPSYPYSRQSGFMSIVSLTAELPMKVLLQGAYVCEDGQINILFEECQVSLGVTRPGRILVRPSNLGNTDKRWLALVVLPGQLVVPEAFSQVLEYAAQSDSDVRVFGTLERVHVEGRGRLSLGSRVMEHPLEDLASLLCLLNTTVSEVIVIGTLDTSLVAQQMAPALTRTPIPKISWIVPDSFLASHPLPIELSGSFITLYDGAFAKR